MTKTVCVSRNGATIEVPAAIDLNVLNATLAALAANQQQQQKQFQQQQMQQQQADQQILWLLS